MTHKVENLLTGEIKEFKTDESFIIFVSNKSMEDGYLSLDTLWQAMNYLNTYCDNLLLL